MSIEFNKVTWYSKLGAVILFLLVVPILTFYIGMKYQETVSVLRGVDSAVNVEQSAQTNSSQTTFSDILNGTYTFDDQKITFVNGKSEQAIAGSAGKITTSIFGQPVKGDLNGDGKQDAIFFVSQETGGTGIFFYVVAAVNQGGKYVGTSGIFLGDRIAPQNINIQNGTAAVNYATRSDGDPMTASASVGVTKYVHVVNVELVEGNVSNFSPQVPIANNNSVIQEVPGVFSEATRSASTSNIVGYFAGGSFFWYVPSWVEKSWNISNPKGADGFTVSPKVVISNRKFSDIVVAVNSSTETYNAVTLYDEDRNSKEGRLIINEVLLNKHGQGMLQINTDTNTRIYHVQREIGGDIYDRYYLDGSGGKTAYVVFHAATEEFSKYEIKIREFVESIGTGTQPQG